MLRSQFLYILAILVRQTYADIENVMLLVDIFKNELGKYSENIQ